MFASTNNTTLLPASNTVLMPANTLTSTPAVNTVPLKNRRGFFRHRAQAGPTTLGRKARRVQANQGLLGQQQLVQTQPVLLQSQPTLLQSQPTLLQSQPTLLQSQPILNQGTTFLQTQPVLTQQVLAQPQVVQAAPVKTRRSLRHRAQAPRASNNWLGAGNPRALSGTRRSRRNRSTRLAANQGLVRPQFVPLYPQQQVLQQQAVFPQQQSTQLGQQQGNTVYLPTIYENVMRQDVVTQVQPIIHRTIERPEIRHVEQHSYQAAPATNPINTLPAIVQETVQPRVITQVQPIVHKEVPVVNVLHKEQHSQEHMVLPTVTTEKNLNAQGMPVTQPLGTAAY